MTPAKLCRLRKKLRKEWRGFVDAAVAQGWSVSGPTGNQRVRLAPPPGVAGTGQIVYIPSTPSAGKREVLIKRSELRRAGLRI